MKIFFRKSDLVTLQVNYDKNFKLRSMPLSKKLQGNIRTTCYNQVYVHVTARISLLLLKVQKFRGISRYF